MRVSTFSRLSVIAIGCFAIIFLATMYHVANTLTQNRIQISSYQELKSLTTVEFYRTISSYLKTGDAAQLTTAEQQLEKIDAFIASLNIPSQQQHLLAKTQQLKSDISGKYRALGKLSGDPLALAKNNEQGLVALINSLANNAQNSNVLTPTQYSQYLLLCQQISTALHHLISARENIFAQQSPTLSLLQHPLSELKTLTDQLNAMPALEIYQQQDTSDDDDLLLDDEEEAEDISEEARTEFNSLVSRYQNELTNTITIKNEQQQGFAQLNQDVVDMEQLILSGEQLILEQQEVLNQNLAIVVTLLMSFLVIFLSVNYGLTRRIVLTPLRRLRDSFVQLVNEGRVDVITGISEKTELGQISSAFNRMVSNLAEQDKQKAKQLALVSSAMQTMERQAETILESSSSTSSHLQAVDEIMAALSAVTETVNTLSQQVVDNAQATQYAMNDSQQKVGEVLTASEATNGAANSGKQAIESLSQSVESVGTIVDVISSIADQTNLLALNAAIEAARAGEHGRGFSVVADEVRQLASKTQESLSQVSARLEQLNQASQSLQNNIYGIEQASSKQRSIAELLKDNAENVVEQALTSANVAQETLSHINQQREHFAQFQSAMHSVNHEVGQSKSIAEQISQDVAEQVQDISSTLDFAKHH